MKTILTSVLLSWVALYADSLMAQTPYAENPTAIDRGKGLSSEQRANMLKKFDRDRNGTIDGKGRVGAQKSLRSKKAGGGTKRSGDVRRKR